MSIRLSQFLFYGHKEHFKLFLKKITPVMIIDKNKFKIPSQTTGGGAEGMTIQDFTKKKKKKKKKRRKLVSQLT